MSVYKYLLATFIGAAWFMPSLASAESTCDMSEAFLQRDNDAKNGTTPVWSDANASSLLFVESLHVNTDGTRRSYSVDDFWGERRALNNLCNAMSDACAGLSNDALRDRRILTQNAFAAGWPRDQLAATKLSSSILPFSNGKPCPLVDGFLVSATALHKPNVTDVCDIDNYVDALTTSGIVIPEGTNGFSSRKAKVGDLAVAMVPGASTPYFAVVGDTGPSDSLGEASIALNGRLLGKTKPPANYLEIRGKGQYKGQDWNVPRAIVLVFPSTANVRAPYMNQEDIDVDAKKEFDKWGGIEKLTACGEKYLK